jgi:hypothetical protein
VEELSAQWLPGDAYINGRQLGPEHAPKNKLPIVDSNLAAVPETPVQAKAKSNRKRTQTRMTAGPKVGAGTSMKV